MNLLQSRKPQAKPQGMNIKEFLAFLKTRPEKERWDLIDGVAIMMNPPTLARNLIAGNLHVILANHLRATGSGLFAFPESGVRIPALDNFLPQPDVMVAPGPAGKEIYSDKFRLVAEVLSPTNRKREIGLKLRRYKEHVPCENVLIIDSRRIWLELHSRDADWQPRLFEEPDSIVKLNAFALSFKLGELYAGTPLAPVK
jgi:Uma2 family endonuclease